MSKVLTLLTTHKSAIDVPNNTSVIARGFTQQGVTLMQFFANVKGKIWEKHAG